MIVSQYRNIFLRLCVLATFAVGLWYFSGKASTRPSVQDGTQAVQYLPIEVKQLPTTDSMGAVELNCGNAELSAPNKIESLPCELVNNTNKRISAVSVAYSIVVEKDGEVSSHDEALTYETFVHPDIREERKDNLIPPKGTRPIRPLPTSFDDAVVKAVSMQIDYVEFEDASSEGPDKVGSRTISALRKGAAKYREWLLRQYSSRGKSIEAMTSLIQDESIPEGELGIENDRQRQGAVMYRNYLRRSYEAKGAEKLAKFLARKSQPK